MIDYHYSPRRFWAKVDKTPTCWNWTASKVGGGYAQFHTNNNSGGYKQRYAHRVSYEAVHGPVPEGMFLDHTCHNRLCVNPGHMRLVTNKQNQENLLGPKATNTSGHRGVTWRKREQRWMVTVTHNRKRYGGGFFKSLNDAATRAAELRNELFTHNDVDRMATK